MADFHVKVHKITQPVINHPNADRLTIVSIGGYQCIANKHDDGSWRYHEGDYIVYIPEGALVPEWLLRQLDMWDEANSKGMLAGARGDRVKAIKLRGVVSQGILLGCESVDGGSPVMPMNNDAAIFVYEGQEVADLLGITKYEPAVPTHLAGEVCNLHGHTIHYDIDSLQTYPDMFDEGESVVVTEKLHGTFCDVAFLSLEHPELFGQRRNIYVASKGLGAKGLVFKNNDANTGNLYVRTLRALLEAGIEDKIYELFDAHDEIHILGEIFGPGVQDLHYGLAAPEFRVFDIKVNNGFAYPKTLDTFVHSLGLTNVPLLYEGSFDRELLLGYRDGQDTVNGAHIREGIVIKSAREARHHIHGRKIAKFVSPDYLLRKNKDATEFS